MKYLTMNEQADKFLRKVERSKEYPAYTDAAFFVKCRRGSRAPAFLPNKCPEADVLKEREWVQTVIQAKLTPCQFNVLCARFRGFGWTEIARALGKSRQTALQIFHTAIRKFKKSLQQNRFRGLYQIYKSEVNRFTASKFAY